MKRKVLIVDDDEKLCKMLGFLFMAKGFEVKNVSRGQLALDTLGSFRADVVILDLMMPGMDGFELCSIIREDPSLDDIPVIVLSALSSSESMDRVAALGAYDYFEKPFKSSELVDRALEAVEGGS